MRMIVAFLLGVALACAVLYSRTMQWLPDYFSSRYSDYSNLPPVAPVPESYPSAPSYPTTPTYPGTPAPTYEPPYPGPSAPPLAIQVSFGDRGAEDVAGCVPAYTVVNSTRRPIVLSQGRRGPPTGDPSPAVIIQPGNRQVACLQNPSPRNNFDDRRGGYRRDDYYGPYSDQGARYGDVPDVPLNIDIRE